MYSSLRHAVSDHVSSVCPKQFAEDLLGKFVSETEEMELERALKRVAGVSGRDCIPDGPRVNDSVDGRKQAAVFECLCHLRGAL